MKLSRKFLNDYLDLKDIKTEEIAEKMVSAGNEYEKIDTIAHASNLVIGEIIEQRPHPESKKLTINMVDIGYDEPVQILCGAANVVKAKKVIVAKIGAKLPGGEIKEANLAGMTSCGMICSLDELGLESKYVTEEDKEGIHILDENAPVGVDALEYLQYNDEIIEFELTANRGDLLSILGMAYEVGAIYKKQVKEPELTFNEAKENIEDIMKLDVTTENCSIYLGKLVKNVVIKESPDFIKARLMASGIRPINNVVDVSNYVMLEYGQPLHFFDYDQLGNHVLVRQANDQEKIQTLDSNHRTLRESDLVIANEKEAVCIAGVMGGYNTEVENKTTNIFIEAAIFDYASIRLTSKDILRSEASNRYEKGIDPNRTEKAMRRACMLLEQYASGEVLSGMLKYDTADHLAKEIDITAEKITKVLGMNISSEEIEAIFKRLGFEVTNKNDKFHVIIPTRRLDIRIEEDLIEEIGRIYGYDNLKGTLPTLKTNAGGYSKKDKEIKGIHFLLTGLSLNGTLNYSLVNQKEADLFTSGKETIQLLSPLSADHEYLRTSLLPSLLNVYSYNKARNMSDILIYEIGNVYYKENDSYQEDLKISGLLSGVYHKNTWNNTLVKVDFYLVKGIVESILDYYGLKGRYSFEQLTDHNEMHPGRSAKVIVDRKVVGILGQVHPKINKNEIYVFELDYNTLTSLKTRGIKSKEISKYPSVKKDVAFIVDQDLESSQIVNTIKKVVGRLLANIEVFDVYRGENIDKDKKSIAYSLTFHDEAKTLTEDEVMPLFNKVIETVETKHNAKLRDK